MVGPYTHHVMIAVPPSALSLARDAESWLRRFLRVALSFYVLSGLGVALGLLLISGLAHLLPVSYTHLTLPTIYSV